MMRPTKQGSYFAFGPNGPGQRSINSFHADGALVLLVGGREYYLNEDVGATILGALIPDRTPRDRVIPELVKGLRHRDAQLRHICANVLERSEVDPLSARREWLKVLTQKEEDPFVRMIAIEALSKVAVPDEEVLGVIQSATADEDAGIRSLALEALKTLQQRIKDGVKGRPLL